MLTLSEKDLILDELKSFLEIDARFKRSKSRRQESFLRVDSWKRIGPNQRGQKCDEDRGWYGLKGACERGKKNLPEEDKARLKKKSAVGLASKIRAQKKKAKEESLKGELPETPPETAKTRKESAFDLKEGDRIRLGRLFRGMPEGDYIVGSNRTQGLVSLRRLGVSGKLVGKAFVVKASSLDAHLGDRVDLNPPPIEPVKRRKKAAPVEDQSTGRVGPSISPKNVISNDPRFSSAALNNALDQIQSEGAAERLSMMRSVIEAQGIQAVWGSKSGGNAKLMAKIENPGRQVNNSLAYIDELMARGSKKAAQRLKKRLINSTVGALPGASGYTFEGSRHVVVTSGRHGSYTDFKVSPQEMQSIADKVLSPADGKRAFSVSSQGKGAAGDLATYLHEVGHQIKWIAAPTAAAPMAKTVSSYGATNENEFFAEAFALWVLDAKGLKSKNPEVYQYVNDSVEASMKASRRIDSMDSRKSRATSPSPADIARTTLGRQAFKLVLSGDKSFAIYQKLSRIANASKSQQESSEVGAAIESFIVNGGDMIGVDEMKTDAIDRIEEKYGLHFDAWKRIGRDQRGQKCGKGWKGLKGACERVRPGESEASAIKRSKRGLADKIRAEKGLSKIEDRNGEKNPMTYKFKPKDSKSSTMTARRTKAPDLPVAQKDPAPPSGRRAKLEKLMGDLKANEERNAENQKAILSVAREVLGMPEQVTSSTPVEQDAPPSGAGAKTRINQLLAKAKKNYEDELTNAAATYTVAQMGINAAEYAAKEKERAAKTGGITQMSRKPLMGAKTREEIDLAPIASPAKKRGKGRSVD